MITNNEITLEMKYYPTMIKPILLKKGTINEYDYYIVNRGLHPCTYINIKKQVPDNVLEDLPVHGGVTYYSKVLDVVDEYGDDDYFIGWDYGHYNDYCGTYSHPAFNETYQSTTFGYEIHQWTTNELYLEAKEAIKNINKILKDVSW